MTIEAVRIALRRLLRSANLDVETFSSGAEFLESLRIHRPDCVLVDLLMLGVNGFAVQTRFAQMGIGLPVVVVSGWAPTNPASVRWPVGPRRAYASRWMARFYWMPSLPLWRTHPQDPVFNNGVLKRASGRRKRMPIPVANPNVGNRERSMASSGVAVTFSKSAPCRVAVQPRWRGRPES